MTTRQILLVVDPDPDWRAILGAYLTFKGWGVVEATDAATALTLAGRERPNAVVSEAVLPHVSGFELVNALRQLPQPWPPVVLVTTLMDLGSSRRAADLECAFLLKPVSFTTVLATVEQLMTKSPVVVATV
jgi:DNA-binding response OmpR family regulator